MITTLIYIVIPLLLLSLAGGLFFLLVDKGETGRRTVYLLGLRVFFATVLIILIAIGLYTGELGNSVPWEDS